MGLFDFFNKKIYNNYYVVQDPHNKLYLTKEYKWSVSFQDAKRYYYSKAATIPDGNVGIDLYTNNIIGNFIIIDLIEILEK